MPRVLSIAAIPVLVAYCCLLAAPPVAPAPAPAPYLGTSGELLVVPTSATWPAPAPVVTPGQVPTVTVDGVAITCPHFTTYGSDVFVVLPAVQPPTAALTVSVPGVTNGAVAVVNNAGKPMTPRAPPPASKMTIGMNTFTPNYWSGAAIDADLMRQCGYSLDGSFSSATVPAGVWTAAAPTTVITTDARGWPQTITGPANETRTLIAQNLPFTGQPHLLRWLGGAEPGLLCQSPTITLGATGTAPDGWSWRVLNTPAGVCTGIQVVVTPPIRGTQVLVPGSFDAATGARTKDIDPRWDAAYGQMPLRWMNAGTNNSNAARLADLKPPVSVTDGGTGRRITAKVTKVEPTTSTYLNTSQPGTPCWLITHDAPGDPFVSGMVSSLYYTVIERRSANQIAIGWRKTPPAVGDTFTVTAGCSYSPERIGQLSNRYRKGCWVNVPHLMEPAGVYDYATRLRDATAPGYPVWVEHSNEIWNGQFSQQQHALGQGLLTGRAGLDALQYGTAQQVAATHAAFRAVFATGGRSSDLKCVLANQSGMDIGNTKRLLTYYRTASDGLWPDVYATAPYLPTVPGFFYTCPNITADAVLDFIERTVTAPYGLPALLAADAAAVAGTPMSLAAYEAGTGQGGPYAQPSWFTLQEQVQSSARMRGTHYAHNAALEAAGFTLKMHFASATFGWTYSSLWASERQHGEYAGGGPAVNLRAQLEWAGLGAIKTP